MAQHPLDRPSAGSLHRILIVRIAAVTAGICMVLAVFVYLVERARFDQTLVDSTMHTVANLRGLLIDQLDAPHLGDHAKIRETIEKFSAYAPRGTNGRYVFARITDTGYETVAQKVDPTYEHQPAVDRYLAEHRHRFAAGEQEVWRRLVTIAGKPHVHVATALADKRGTVVAYAEGVYAVSDEAVAGIRRRILRTVLLSVAVVLVIVSLLYPVILHLLRRVATLSVHLLEANLTTIQALGNAIAKRDSDTDLHNYRVTIYAVRLAEALGLKEPAIRSLIKGAFLHDVGKIGIGDEILHKPARLTAEEFLEMKRHVQHGRDIVSGSVWLQDALDVVGGHHEKFDGTGYDAKRKSAEIPVLARLFSIIDVFDALTSERPYKKPLAFERTLELLEEGRGTQFDPEILNAFRGIARGLYDQFAATDRESLRKALDAISLQYFSGDIGAMLENESS
jgi:HD-GYP domain-containing protein (c-di-GMP phosphodiesterase class II)